MDVSALRLADLSASALTLLLIGFFALSWRRSGEGTFALVACGFLLLGASYPFIAASHFDPDRSVDAWDAARLAGQTAGALCLAIAYAWRAPRARPLRAIVAMLALGAVGILVAAWALRDASGAVPLRPLLAAAHLLQVVGLATCAAGAARGWRRSPSLPHALPPAGFAVLAAGKLTWLALTLSGSDALLAVVYAARFAGLALLILAVALPATAWRPRITAEDAA